jgi:hypothetical protein
MEPVANRGRATARALALPGASGATDGATTPVRTTAVLHSTREEF